MKIQLLSDLHNEFLCRWSVHHDVDSWIFGLTHTNIDITISGTRLITNQAEHPGENVSGYVRGLLIDAKENYKGNHNA